MGNTLDLINDGESVSAGVANRPLLELQQGLNYLQQLVNSLAPGSTVFARGVGVESAALVGHAVYFNAATARFERALASVTADPGSGALIPSPSSDVWGVVFSKSSAVTADILLFGYDQLDISPALESGTTVAAGVYYLSRITPGTLTAARPPVPVPVLRSAGNGFVFVNPRWEDLLHAHSHLHFSLQPVPAGTHVPPPVGGRHAISDPNPHVEGWLPADHPSFGGKAPHDAKFGYNLAASPSLKNVWPPLPPSAASLYWDGVLTGPDLVVFDTHGIWWMSDCYETVPWLSTTSTIYERVSESVAESESLNACPHDAPVRLDLFLTQNAFLDNDNVVNSLVTADARVLVECAGKNGTPASSGPLQLRLNLSFLSDDNDPGGYLAIKSFDPATQKFHRGPVATGLYAVSGNVVLSGDNVVTVNGRTYYRGNVGVDITTSFNRELFPSLVRLDGVTEEYFENVMYLGFAAGEQTGIRVRIQVPELLDVNNPNLTLKLRLFGLSSGVLPPLGVTARRIPKTSTPLVLPPTDLITVSINTAVTLTAANQYVDVAGTPFAIAAGDDLLLTIQRLGTDSYPNQMGLLRVVGVITS